MLLHTLEMKLRKYATLVSVCIFFHSNLVKQLYPKQLHDPVCQLPLDLRFGNSLLTLPCHNSLGSNLPLLYLYQALRHKSISSLYSFPPFPLFYILFSQDVTYSETEILVFAQKVNRSSYTYIQHVKKKKKEWGEVGGSECVHTLIQQTLAEHLQCANSLTPGN